MVDIKAKSVPGYVLQILSVIAIVLGTVMAVSGAVRADLFGIILGVVLAVGGAIVTKRLR